MQVYITIVLILVFLLLHILLLRNTKLVYNLSENRSCNYFEIYNIKEFIQGIHISSNKILIDDFLPENIEIKNFPDKGWGLVSKVIVKKDDIIYKSPLARFPEDGIEFISKDHGIKKINKKIHCSDLEKKYKLFTYFDCLLNHDNNPSAYHDTSLLIDSGKIYVILRALDTIHPGNEITIDYYYLNEYIYYFRSFLQYILQTQFIKL